MAAQFIGIPIKRLGPKWTFISYLFQNTLIVIAIGMFAPNVFGPWTLDTIVRACFLIIAVSAIKSVMQFDSNEFKAKAKKANMQEEKKDE